MGADAARKRKRAALREGADVAQPAAKLRILEDSIPLDVAQNKAHPTNPNGGEHGKQEESNSRPKKARKEHKAATRPETERADEDLPIAAKPPKRKKVKSKPSPDKPADSGSPDPSATPKPKRERFIAFIGNLPYSATTASISAHFSSLKPTSIRHSTDKATGRSNGYAFLELPTYDKLLTCLTKFHHSIFAPPHGISDANRDPNDKRQEKAGRKINVELTAGGGGKNSTFRKGKLEKKNESLELRRERRRKKEAELAEVEKKVKRPPETGANAEAKAEVKIDKEPEKEGIGRDAIHPSRLKLVK